MEKIIPLHSFVLVSCRDQKESVNEAVRLFPQHEILTLEKISMELVGENNRPDLFNILISEIKHRISLKLSLGERVVLASYNLRRDLRLIFGRMAKSQGASLVYIISAKEQDKNILLGDGLNPSILINNFNVIKPLPENPMSFLSTKFRGITVIGDVHGKLKKMKEALSWAKSRNHFVWFLGDVVDYGEDTLKTISLAYDTVMSGDGGFIIGNHERKIARWLSQQETSENRSIKMSEGNRITIDALSALTREEKIQWCGKFRSLLSRASLMKQLSNFTFVHAAIHPDVWRGHTDHQEIEDFALYGEPNPLVKSPDFGLSYRWVDAVPGGQTVFVGHDVRSTLAPMAVTNSDGGRVIFLDTGSGKNGALSTADLRFTANGLHLECFNRY